jgi:dipeptidyl aminopeptidase/acylaminoacyl peptidase
MLKTTRQFYMVLVATLALLIGASLFLLWSGDSVGKPLKATFNFAKESGIEGLPQVAINFEQEVLPQRAVAETAFKIEPEVAGDFVWKNSALIFIPAKPLQTDTEYKVSLRGGLALLNGGRTDFNTLSWTFRTDPARLVFLKREGKAVNLWSANADGTNARALTRETTRQVLSFSVSPGGNSLIYSLQESDSHDSGLWSLKIDSPDTNRQLFFDKGFSATNPRWAPSGTVIGFERRANFDNGGFSASQLWLVRPDGTLLPPLHGGSGKVGLLLQWLNDKAYFWDSRREAVAIANLGLDPQWLNLKGMKLDTLAPAPDGKELILAYYDYSGAEEQRRLKRLTQNTALSEPVWEFAPQQPASEPGFNDISPVWSPDGKKLAFIRQQTKSNLSQISGAGLLGENLPKGIISSFKWSPDGKKLIFEFQPQGQTNRSRPEQTELWEVSLAGRETKRLLTGVFAVQWVN